MSKHSATKVYAGRYIYRGFEIERVDAHDGQARTEWLIWTIAADGLADQTVDVADTMKAAKAMIDRWS